MTGTYPRILLAAPKSGSGKTMMTCGLLKAFQLRNIPCCSFKCGPDYIDPMFHKSVLGIDGANLDTYFLKKSQAREHFIRCAGRERLSVIEGVMGYYDGVGGWDTWASTYEVASAVKAPVVLIVDCRKASLSLAALVKGFLEYKEDSRIKGVILNRISPVMAERLKPKLTELSIQYFGYVPECQAAKLDSRHLGLKLPGEVSDLEERLKALAEKLEETVDIDGLLELARKADQITVEKTEEGTAGNPFRNIPIGVARDEAFCFYYQENLRLLEDMGARLISFSPVHDKSLPEGICGLLLGGGYPELYAKQLSDNVSMRQEIQRAAKASMPVLAECGGFMYLHEKLETKEGKTYPMAGVIKGRAFPTDRLKRFGYLEAYAREDEVFLKKGESIRGHEFHYWDSTHNGDAFTAIKPGADKGWECIFTEKHTMAGFPHFYYPSNPVLPKRFMEACKCFLDQWGKYRKDTTGDRE